LPTSGGASRPSGGTFDYPDKQERLTEVLRELEDPQVWNQPERAQALGRERARLEGVVGMIDKLAQGIADAGDLLAMAVEENDSGTVDSVAAEVEGYEREVGGLEFRRMFAGETDPNNAYLDIQAGAGGTEAQDWAEMLLRMYLRWCEKKGFKAELMEVSPGEVAGIKSATIYVQGDYAFGWLRTETGVHRLVRKSPFDSNARRHTSFAAVFVSRRSTTTSPSRSTPPICASTSIVRRAPAASTSTAPSRPCASRTCRPASSCSARTTGRSTRTATRR